MSVATAPTRQQRAQRRPPRGAGAFRGLGRLLLVASPSLYVLALLIVPVGLIGMYSVNRGDL